MHSHRLNLDIGAQSWPISFALVKTLDTDLFLLARRDISKTGTLISVNSGDAEGGGGEEGHEKEWVEAEEMQLLSEQSLVTTLWCE